MPLVRQGPHSPSAATDGAWTAGEAGHGKVPPREAPQSLRAQAEHGEAEAEGEGTRSQAGQHPGTAGRRGGGAARDPPPVEGRAPGQTRSQRPGARKAAAPWYQLEAPGPRR